MLFNSTASVWTEQSPNRVWLKLSDLFQSYSLAAMWNVLVYDFCLSFRLRLNGVRRNVCSSLSSGNNGKASYSTLLVKWPVGWVWTAAQYFSLRDGESARSIYRLIDERKKDGEWRKNSLFTCCCTNRGFFVVFDLLLKELFFRFIQSRAYSSIVRLVYVYASITIIYQKI